MAVSHLPRPTFTFAKCSLHSIRQFHCNRYHYHCLGSHRYRCDPGLSSRQSRHLSYPEREGSCRGAHGTSWNSDCSPYHLERSQKEDSRYLRSPDYLDLQPCLSSVCMESESQLVLPSLLEGAYSHRSELFSHTKHTLIGLEKSRWDCEVFYLHG